VSDVAQPSDGPPELPSDYRAFRRPYRWLLVYGPWALAVLGVALIGVGLFADRPGEVALAAIGFGAAMSITGVLLPRMQGPLELGPSGVKGAVHGLPAAFMVAAVTAREVAEDMIPANEPDRDRKVDRAVERAANHWVNMQSLRLFLDEPRPEKWGPDYGRWAGDGLREMLASDRLWTEEDWTRFFRAKRHEEELRRKPPHDQGHDS